MPLICFILLILLGPSVVAQDHYSSSIPDIHEFVYVDFQPTPTNLQDVMKSIGYPAKAYKEGIEGYVHCRILVDLQGRYMAHKITKATHPLLSDAVESNLDKLRFLPAMRDNLPICYWVNIPINFHKKDYPPYEFKRPPKSIKKNQPLFPRHKKVQGFLEEGRRYFAEKQYLKARRAIRSAIFLSPKGKNITAEEKLFLSNAWAFLGMIELQNAVWSFATDAYSEAIAIRREVHLKNDTTLTYLYLKRAQALLQSQQLLRAIDDVNWIFHTHTAPHLSIQAFRTRAHIFYAMKDYEAALSDIEMARQASPSLEHYYCKARIFYEMKAYASAEETLKEGEALGILPSQDWKALKDLIQKPVASH
ncbi:MAG: TonB family protein [Bacteroidota bacterium]